MESEDIRIAAVQSVVRSWAPQDKRGRDSKRRFEDQLKKAIEELAPAGDETEVQVTSSAIVVGPQGTLLHPHDLMPTWVAPGGHVAAGELPWNAAKREVEAKTGVSAQHPEDGPQLVSVELQQTPEGRTRLDLRFLLFGDGEASGDRQARWFKDDEAKTTAAESYRHALEVAHTLRDQALR